MKTRNPFPWVVLAAGLVCFTLLFPERARAEPSTLPVVTPARDAIAAPVPTPPRPLLWKVSDGDNVLYLLGSFHLLSKQDYPLSQDVESAFADAELVYFEISPEEMARVNASNALPARSERRLSDVLPPAVREKLAIALLETGRRVDDVESMQPWAVNMAVLTGITDSLGLSASRGLDQHLMGRALTAGKRTGGLETAGDQRAALESVSLAVQIKALDELLEHRTLMARTIADLYRAWRNGDVDLLDKLARRSMQENNPESYELINVARNARWLPIIQSMLDGSRSDDALVVVGSLHLLGEDGLVHALQRRGYQVERVCSDCAAPAAR
ncbi:MAG TPA: TraB/GumN family protein [Lysobacter sp.]|nr:TraB/GumN family protein [Lysobacter sp.]